MEKFDSIEEYIEKQEKWTDALHLLREIMISTELEETLKWSIPTYTLNNKNVLGFAGFKNHFGIWFFNGVFLKDEQKLLHNAQEGKTKAMLQMRFTSIEQIDKKLVLSYVKEAIANQKAGKVMKANRQKKETIIPIELQTALNNQPSFKDAFNRLTPGKQREYCEHVASAKREATKLSRLEKIKPMILEGVGLNDKYKNC